MKRQNLDYRILSHRRPNGMTLEYIVADMPEGARYRPGYVNSVSFYPEPCGDGYCVVVTDGYKEVHLPIAADRASAITKALYAIENGAGGGQVDDGTNGFSSYFCANAE